MNIRVLDHPLERKDLKPFSWPGVYIFLPLKRAVVERELATASNPLDFLLALDQVLYIGKAKQLNQRLQTYRRPGGTSAGEWYKATKLAEMAQCVLIVPTPTHFEACLLELFLIRLIVPEFNDSSTSAGKIHFVQQNKNTRQISVSSRKRPEMKTLGFVRLRSEMRLAVDALQEALQFYEPETSEVQLKPLYSRFGRTIGPNRLVLDVSAKNADTVAAIVKGRRTGLPDALWRAMKKAAASEQFHQAAHLRDMFLAIRQMQAQLVRSRKILRRFRNNRFVIAGNSQLPPRQYTIHRFAICDFAYSECIEQNEVSKSFFTLMKSAVDSFYEDLSEQSELEKLRVNFEFLRLMLWWLVKQPEACSSR